MSYNENEMQATNLPTGLKKPKYGEINAETMQLLQLIKDFLDHGDQIQVARKLKVTPVSVNKVLSGETRSPRILAALYAKAVERRNEDRWLYQNPKEAIKQLQEGGDNGFC